MSNGLVVVYVVRHTNHLADEAYGVLEVAAPLVPDDSCDRHTAGNHLHEG
jgi:hypothetical protein